MSNDYTKTIKTKLNCREVTDRIGRVSEWWSKNFEGKSRDVGDIFSVSFKSCDMYKVKVSEIIADKKIVWEVIDANQSWVKEPKEWAGTKIAWEVYKTEDGSEVSFTHIGLVPTLECFNKCTMGWDWLMTASLSKLLNEGTGSPV
jgi:hypothetical protein